MGKRSGSGVCALVTLKVDREITEDVHWQLADLPAYFPRHIENEQAVDAGLVLRERDGVRHKRRAALVMNVKRVAVAGVVVDRRCDLEKQVVFGKCEPCPGLPSEQERVRVRDQLVPVNSSDLRGCCCAWPERIFRIRIVVNKLREVDEEIELQLKRLTWRGRDDTFAALLAVAFSRGGCRSAAELKIVSMFPLLGQTLRIDVGVPHHWRVNKRVRHSAAGQRDIFEAFIAEISLADIDAVVVLGKRSVVAVVSKRDVRRAIIGVGFQANSKEPVVCQDSAQSDSHAITLALAFLPIVMAGDAILRTVQRR